MLLGWAERALQHMGVCDYQLAVKEAGGLACRMCTELKRVPTLSSVSPHRRVKLRALAGTVTGAVAVVPRKPRP
jgi:hypothetical protein